MKKEYSPDKSLDVLLAFDCKKAQTKPEYTSKLEEDLINDTDNFQLRCKLVGAYFVNQKPELTKHLMWFVERYANKRFISSPFFYVPMLPNSHELTDLWEKQVIENPTNVDVLVNFVYVIPDKKRKAAVLDVLQKLYPRHSRVIVLSKFLKDTAYPPHG